MNDLTTRLRDADPLRAESGLPLEARDAMRRAIVAAADAGVPRIPRWRQPFALAAMATFALFGAALAHRVADEQGSTPAAVPDIVAPATTQVQFRTPGGTRIVWTIDPAFQLGGPRS